MKLNLTVSLCNLLVAIFASAVVAFTYDKTGAAADVRDVNSGLLVVSVASVVAVAILPMILKSKLLLTVVDTAVGMALIVLGIVGVVRAEEYRKSLPEGTTADAALACAYTSASLALVCGVGMAAVSVKGSVKL